jgi:lambda repressor-like predicted transcriptional regulator
MKCAARCDREATTLGWCGRHYSKAWRLGIGAAGAQRRVDPAEVIAHIHLLRERGWSWQAIGDTAGVAMSVPHQLVSGKHPKVSRVSAQAILAIDPVPVESGILVHHVGTRRRVDALARMGWPVRLIEERAGLQPRTLVAALYRERVTALVSARVAKVYAELSSLQGPSRLAASLACSRGALVPMAWEYADIDDPKAKPFQGFYRESA